MENMAVSKHGIILGIGIFGSIAAELLGGWDIPLESLCLLIVLDYFSGLVAAGVFHKSKKTDTGGLSSYVGFKGILKKILVLMSVVIAVRIDLTLNMNYVRNATVMSLIINELLSLTENFGLMGLDLAPPIRDAIDVLKKKESSKDDEKEESKRG